MKTFALNLLICACLGFHLTAQAAKTTGPAELAIHEIHYAGRLADDEARFTMTINATATGPEASLPLLSGEVAILSTKMPDGLNLVRQGNDYQLRSTRAGNYKFQLELAAKIQRNDPWNQVSFTGPLATIAALTAQTTGTNTEIQLLNGTQLENSSSNGINSVTGFLGTEQTVALRWQGKIMEIVRNALLTVDSEIHAQITPSLVRYTSTFHYNIVQGTVSRLIVTFPATQSLTRLVGDQIRDWQTTVEGDHQALTVEFLKPMENSYELILFSEQAPTQSPAQAALNPPQPQAVERESGSITVSAEDIQLEVAAMTGLRQANATDQDFAAYQYNARPFALLLALKHLDPVIGATDQVHARLEETRLLVTHHLQLDVEKAGIYSLELTCPTGLAVVDVNGDSLDDWKVTEGKLRVNFVSRLLGPHALEVQLEQPLKTFPEQIGLEPLQVAGAAHETAQIGVAAAPGIRMKTGTLSGLREIPINNLPNHNDEILAYATEQPDWKLSIGSERLSARIVADVFNLVTIGNGLVGGSATIRYGLANQGVQEFKVRLPEVYRNVEFTGPNIRRKEIVSGAAGSGNTETNDVVWTIGLQDKAWDGYTLVVTYDYPFNPVGAALPIGGIHAMDVERETGSVAITAAASLQINARQITDTLHRVDESELSAADHSLITRAVILAYQYTGDQYHLAVEVKRYAEEPVLEAVADRTQITSVLTEAGEMLTQASFMVKNNEKQFQRFELPPDAKLWGCYVNGQPAKPERDGEWVMVSLPRDLNHDEAFAVDIMYAQTNSLLNAGWRKTLNLTAPRTDVPNTYAEWQVYAPPALRLTDFGGTMKVTQGTTYELLDAWQKFIAFYGQVIQEAGPSIFFIGLLAFLVVALVISAVRRGWNGVVTLLGVVFVLAVLGAMLLPALSSAKRKAQRISSVNNLKEIGLAIRIFAGDNTNRLPTSFEEMRDELGTDRITYDPQTGERYTYLPGSMTMDELKPDSVMAFSPIYKGGCNVLFADGSVAQMTAAQFDGLSQRGLVATVSANQTGPAPAMPSEENSKKENGSGDAAGKPQVTNSLSGEEETFAKLPDNAANGQYGMTAASAPATVGGSGAFMAPSGVPSVAGIRSLRIELPTTGQPFLFTKVLNVRDEPLSIRARVTTLQIFKFTQMVWQSLLFLFGVLLWWWQWQRPHRNTFILTLSLALMIGAIGSLLIEWRALHDALIIGFPMVTMGVVAFLVWRYWPRQNPPNLEASAPTPITPTVPATPPFLATVVLLMTLCLENVSAALVAKTPPITSPTILSADYSGTVDDRVASLDVQFQFSGVKAGAIVSLFSSDVAVQAFSARNNTAELVRAGDQIAIQFKRDGDVRAQIKMLVKVTGDVTKRRLVFATPPALTGQLSLVLDQPEAEVDFPSAISFKRSVEKEKVRVDAILGSDHQVELAWTPRVKSATEISATIFCHNAAAITLGDGVINTRATLDYQITQGELRQARVQIPVGQRLLRVEAPGMRTWELKKENGASVLVVDLTKGISPDWRLTIETETALAALPASVQLPIPHALMVKREDGLLALRNSPDLALSVDSTAGLERVDAREFSAALGGETNSYASAFRFATTDFSLRTHVEAVQPEIEAVVENQFRVSPEQVLLAASVEYQIKRVGLFNLKVAIPEGYKVDQVEGENIVQELEHSENNQRILEVTLKERTSGTYRLNLELTHSYRELPKTLAAAGIHPLGTGKLTGYVTVTAEPGVTVKTDGFDGLTEIPATGLPNLTPVSPTGNVLAYKYISAEPGSQLSWKLSVKLEPVAAWVRAEIVNHLTLSELLVTGYAQIRYNIANAPVKELSIRVPDQFENVEINGLNIRSRGRAGQVWHIELQSPVSGFYNLAITWDQSRSGKSTTVELKGVSAEGVERETGLLALSAKAPLQLTEATATNVQRADASDLPDWSGPPDSSLALVYRYVQPGYQLAVNARHFEEAEVLQALVDDAHLTSVVAEDGQMMTELSLSVRNNGLQFLEVELPANASVWSAFVGGQAVRPSKREGKLLLPVESTETDSAIPVELTYVDTNIFPQLKGSLGFVSPKFDVPLKNARWEFYLPAGYDYQNFQGTMSRELMTTAESSTASFSKLDYSRMEKASKDSDQVEIKREVSEARQQLISGDVRQATASYNRVRTKSTSGVLADAEMQTLEKDLQKAQASNLINAQSYFTARNSADSPAANERLPSDLFNLNGYNDVTAGEQWDKLQQAQEVMATRVQPLRVNLPIHGLHYTFTQVLQTEGGKPMTVRLFATSDKLVNWPLRTGVGAAVFFFMWGLVTCCSHFSLRRQSH